MAATLPIDQHLDRIVDTVATHPATIVEAPPGAGKTTRVPPALAAAYDAGRIVVLEPRRVAARAAANRMAAGCDEAVGATVGITTRGDRRVSPATRIEVVTEGVLLRRLQRDPSLEGTSVVVLDEFHERSLDADLSLAFLRESQAALRDDLHVVVMSATLDGERVSRLLDEAPVIRTEGRTHPVEVRHVARRPDADGVVAAVLDVLDEINGGVLVFLPGAREIRDVVATLRPRVGNNVDVRPLYGALSSSDQDAALHPPAPGRRKVVVATDIAESSVTVAGVEAVVDAGLSREPRQHPGTGMTRLVTVPASVASADQRAGRAGRERPGIAVRLWSLADHARRDAAPRPGIVTDDLTSAALQVASWGADVEDLDLLDRPDPQRWAQALDVLRRLGAWDDGITSHGRELAEMPLHPRLAHLVRHAVASGHGPTGVALAALLQERDPVDDRHDRDLRTRLEVLDGRRHPGTHAGALRVVQAERRRLARRLHVAEDPIETDVAGGLVAVGWPDRIATARDRRGTFTLANGRGARVQDGDPLAGADLLVVVDADDRGRDAWIWSAVPVTLDDLVDHLGDRLAWRDVVRWDDGRRDVVAVRERHLDDLVVSTTSLASPDADAVGRAVCEGLRRHGLGLLPWRPSSTALRRRAHWVATHTDHDWPPLDDRHLLDRLEDWLLPYVGGVRTLGDISADVVDRGLREAIGWDRVHRLDQIVPASTVLPSGREVPVDYREDGLPTVSGKLQEFFGPDGHPRVAGVPLRVELLSPAGRPVHVTSDLPGFWRGTYADVRADLRGRYPKHPWPEDPTSATPTRRTKNAMRRQ